MQHNKSLGGKKCNMETHQISAISAPENLVPREYYELVVVID